MQDNTFVQPAPDGLYSMINQKAFVNADTMHRSSNIQVAMEGGTALLGNGALNNPNGGATTTIKVLDSPGSKLRLGGVAIRIRGVIHDQGNTGATAPANNNVPSWCNIARAINKVTISVNASTGAGTFYSSTDGHFLEEFIARCLTQYTWQQLSSMSETLFLPMDDRTYITGDPANAAGAPTDVAALERYNNYTLNTLNTHTIQVTKVIPLSLLCGFPRDGICKNLREITIEIRWNAGIDILDHYTSVAANLADYTITGCDALTDHYLPSGDQLVANAISRAPDSIDKDFDILPFLHADFHTVNYAPGSEIVIPNVKSFHSVMIFQLANGMNNGQAGADLRNYYGSGQFMFGGNSAANATLVRTRAFHPAGVPAGSIVGWTSAQIQFQGADYPNQAMALSATSNGILAPDFTQAYFEYLKAIGRAGRKDTGGAIPFDVFRSTMPFLMFKPFADTPKMPGSAGDLIIRLAGGVAGNIVVICWQYKIAAISPSGVLTMF